MSYSGIFSQDPQPYSAQQALNAIIRLHELGVKDKDLYVAASIRLDPDGAMEVIRMMGPDTPVYVGYKLDANAINRGYRHIPVRVLYAAVSHLTEPLEPRTIIGIMNIVGYGNKEPLYYAMLDRYLIDNNMSEVEFLQRYDPNGSRLAAILRMYPLNPNDQEPPPPLQCRNETTILMEPIHEVHPDQVYTEDGYCYTSADVMDYIKRGVSQNPYTRGSINTDAMKAFVQDLMRRGIPVYRAGKSFFYDTPYAYDAEPPQMVSEFTRQAYEFGSDLRWLITINKELYTLLAVLLGGAMYISYDMSGYTWSSGTNTDTLFHMTDLMRNRRLRGDRHDVELAHNVVQQLIYDLQRQ